MQHIKKMKYLALGVLGLALMPAPAQAFCGFYVAKADTDLFNDASKVVIARDGDNTVITMANDYRGAATEFAMVVPVPTVLEEGQIHVTDHEIVDHLDAYTSPRWSSFSIPTRAANMKGSKVPMRSGVWRNRHRWPVSRKKSATGRWACRSRPNIRSANIIF